jgi:ribosomal protein S17E
MNKKNENKMKKLENKVAGYTETIRQAEIEEMQYIIQDLMQYKSKGELYEDIINQLKVRLSIDAGLLDEEVKTLLKEASTEIKTLRAGINNMIAKNLTIKGDCQEMASALYLFELCEGVGLKGKQKKRVFELLEGITDKEEIDNKFIVLLEHFKEDKLRYIENALGKIKSKKVKNNVANFFSNYGKDLFCSKRDVDGAIKSIIEMGK